MKDKKELIELSLEKVIKKFSNHEFLIQDYINYSPVLKNRYLKNKKLHINRRKCEVDGCDEISIKKSHSIPKSSILKNIASNGHLLVPQYDYTNSFPRNKMTRIGVNNASVFPGFCIKHEGMFSSFEKDGKFDNANKALLQTYRTLCRERIYREIELEINQNIKEEYIEKLNLEAQDYFRKLLLNYPYEIKVEKVDLKGVDSVIHSLNRLQEFLSSPLEKFKLFEKEIFELLNENYTNSNLILRVVNLDFHIPVAMCGFGEQVYLKNNLKKRTHILINIMPNKASTDVICVGMEEDLDLIEKFLDFSFSNPLNALNLIESFMINGTDHWYINPDYWNNFSEEKQEKILYDILFSEDSFFDEYNFSIFDDIRIKVINSLKFNISARKEPITSFEESKIKMELNKINTPILNEIDKEILTKKLNQKFSKY